MDETVLKTIRETIKETVNGKIDNLSKKVDEYIEADMAYKDETRVWRQDVEKRLCELSPVSEGVHMFKTFRTGSIYFAGVVTSVTVIIGAIVTLIKFAIK